ncbi:hypothetical protein R1sor_011715 [Riccia sorocarpa]|uniref:Uncharacterized protein n=1 Tax=Riccia sorocarpa TaxID=122646 RepID=A0ABD3I7T6_9MARC
MHSSCKNLLQCIDILSVALVVGLALEDGPPRKSRSSQEKVSETNECQVEEISETSECQETNAELEGDENSNQGENKKNQDEEEKAKMDHKVVTQMESSSSVNSNVNPDPSSISHLPITGPERDENVMTVRESSPAKLFIYEKITLFTDETAKDESSSSSSSEFPEIILRKDNLKRKLVSRKVIYIGEESEGDSSGSQNHPTAGKRARNYTTDSSDSSESPTTSTNNSRTFDSSRKHPTRAYHHPETLGRIPTRRDSSTDDDDSFNGVRDQVSESDSEEDQYRRPTPATNFTGSKKGSGASKDQGVSEAEFVQHVQESFDQVPTAAVTKTKELHSNSGRELETAAAIRDRLKNREQDNAVKDQGVSEAEFVQHVQESLEKAPAFRVYTKEGLHSNSGRELESAAAIKHATTSYESGSSSTPELPKSGKQGLHSNTTANSAVPHKTKLEKQGLHSNTGREVVGAPRRLSQRGLIGNSVAAALHMPTQSVENHTKSRTAGTPQPQPKRKLSTRSLVGLSYEQQLSQSSDPQRAGGSNGGRDQGNQKRKLSQNDLISLGHLALRDTWDANNAGPSSCSQSNKAPVLDPYPVLHDERDEEIGVPEEINNCYPPPPLTDEQQMKNHQETLSYQPPAPPDEDILDDHQPSSNRFHHYPNNLNPEPQFWTSNSPNRDYFPPSPVDISRLTSNRHPEPVTVTRRDHNHPCLRVRHPGDRMLHRRPRCGLLIVKAMREDNSLPVERRKGNRVPRTPGSIDINFHPRVGDIILRHVRLPGQAVVEIWYPGFHAQDGDSLVRIKLDPFSYDSGARESSNLLIIKAKGYIFFEDMWIYMGRATHSIIKAHQRVLGVGAANGRTLYAS